MARENSARNKGNISSKKRYQQGRAESMQGKGNYTGTVLQRGQTPFFQTKKVSVPMALVLLIFQYRVKFFYIGYDMFIEEQVVPI